MHGLLDPSVYVGAFKVLIPPPELYLLSNLASSSYSYHTLFNFFLILIFLAVPGLCCSAQAFSSCDVQASHCSASLVEHRL